MVVCSQAIWLYEDGPTTVIKMFDQNLHRSTVWRQQPPFLNILNFWPYTAEFIVVYCCIKITRKTPCLYQNTVALILRVEIVFHFHRRWHIPANEWLFLGFVITWNITPIVRRLPHGTGLKLSKISSFHFLDLHPQNQSRTQHHVPKAFKTYLKKWKE